MVTIELDDTMDNQQPSPLFTLCIGIGYTILIMAQVNEGCRSQTKMAVGG
jgi:hypothetical protein